MPGTSNSERGRRRAATPHAPALLRRVEAMSLAAIEQHWELIPGDVARRGRPVILRIGDGLLTLMAKSDSLRLNRVTGLGHRGEAEDAMIDAVIERARCARVRRLAVIVGPGPQSAEIGDWLERRGFAPHGAHTLLLRDARRPVPAVDTALRVIRARRDHREAMVRILGESFPTPPSRREWARAAVASPRNLGFLALAGRVPIAAATLRIAHGLAWLGGAATRTRWRRRGAQSALIAARLRRAASAGCEWAWSETAAPVRGRPDGSRRNLVRLGFEPAALKRIYVWEAS